MCSSLVVDLLFFGTKDDYTGAAREWWNGGSKYSTGLKKIKLIPTLINLQCSAGLVRVLLNKSGERWKYQHRHCA